MDATALVRMLVKAGYRISTAESCTGGLVAAAIVAVPDASKVLDVGIITYANEAKMRYAGVSEESLKCFGAVSEQVAGEMAKGVACANDANIGVATSGIAGPGGGTPEKPVGTVCFGAYVCGKVYTCTEHFPKMERNEVREAASAYAISWVERLLSLAIESKNGEIK